MDFDQWQISEIKKGIEEADRGEFASEEDLQNLIQKWSDLKQTNPSKLPSRP